MQFGLDLFSTARPSWQQPVLVSLSVQADGDDYLVTTNTGLDLHLDYDDDRDIDATMTAAQAATLVSAPVNLVAPSLAWRAGDDGTKVGDVIEIDPGDWVYLESNASKTLTWVLRVQDGADIAGTIDATSYAITAGEQGQTLELVVTADDSGAGGTTATFSGFNIPVSGLNVPATAATFAALAIWDASDTPTLWQDTAGGTAGAVDQPVGYMADTSGNGNDAVQNSTSQRPYLRRTAGGIYYLEMDGVNDCMVFPEASFAGAFAIVAAVQFYDTTARTILGLDGASGPRTPKLSSADATRDFFFRAVNGGSSLGADVADHHGTNIVMTAMRDSSDVVSGRINGTSIGLSDTQAGTATFSMIGADNGNQRFYGRLYGLALIDGDDAANLAAAEAWAQGLLP